MTDILTPYYVVVHDRLSKMVDLTVLYCSRSGTRALDWAIAEPEYQHRVIDGLTIRRHHPDATDFYLSPRIFTSLVRIQPDAVIAGGYSFPSAYSATYCAMRRRPLLIHSDGTSASEKGLGRLQELARAVVVPRATAAIANSGPAATRFIELGFTPDRVFHAPHSTDVAPFHAIARSRDYGAPGTLRILATGRLIERKGFDRLIRSYAVARATRPGITLRIVGTGPAMEALRGLADQLRVPVEFAGFVDQDRLPAEYATADVYAFPTLDDPFGIVLLEAMASGLPVIASPRGGATEDLVVIDGNGFVIDPDDIDAAAEAFVRLADDPALRARLGRDAYETSLPRTPEATARGYADAVNAVLAGMPETQESPVAAVNKGQA